MANRNRYNPLDLINPITGLFGDQIADETEDEDNTPIAEGSLKVYKLLFRMLEQWKYMPAEGRNGGIRRGMYLGEIDDSAIVAREVIKVLQSFFGGDFDLSSDTPNSDRSPRMGLEETKGR